MTQTERYYADLKDRNCQGGYGTVELKLVTIEKPEDANIIVGQTHFIKTVEDLYEVCVNANPNLKFGLAFCESSGACLIRVEGNDGPLKDLATRNARAIAAGHVFVLVMREGYPINVLNAIKMVPEVCSIYAATANPLQIVVAESEQGRGILGVIDGFPPKGVEDEEGVRWRKGLLRQIGYKIG